VHTFYEAVGIMISAQVNSKIQEQLIDKYMLLPNLIWDDCISQASKVIVFFLIFFFSIFF
jgi:exportin-1